MKRFTPIPISNEFDMPAIRIVEDKEGRYVRHKDAIAEIEALKVQIEVLQSALRRTIRVWLVDDEAYDPEGETERRMQGLLAEAGQEPKV